MNDASSETLKNANARFQKYARASSIRNDKDYYYGKFALSATEACDEQTETKILRSAVFSIVDIAVCPPKDMVQVYSHN